MSRMQWYSVLACYKFGIIVEGTRARAYAGRASSEIGDRLHLKAITLFERALKWIT
jgi:hypothetical protein